MTYRIPHEFWSLGHDEFFYGVDISPGEDDVSILCTTLIIDELLFEQDRKM